MKQSLLILVLATVTIAAPVLCDAGITAHECHCEEGGCCAEGTACEADPCDDVRQELRFVHDPSERVTADRPAVIMLAPPPWLASSLETTDQNGAAPPYADGNLPLRA